MAGPVARARYWQRRNASLCTSCGLPSGDSGRCAACVAKQNARYKNRKASGICKQCKSQAQPGTVYCEVHASEKRQKSNGYTLSLDDKATLFNEQGGVCAICGLPPAKKHKNDQNLHVDHDHVSKKVRGLLCAKCNKGLGMFNDRVDLLERSAAYLRASS